MNSPLQLLAKKLLRAEYQHKVTCLVIECFPFPKQSLVFTCLQDKSFENTVEKGDIDRNKQFLLFPQCFLPVWRATCHFHQTRNCRL